MRVGGDHIPDGPSGVGAGAGSHAKPGDRVGEVPAGEILSKSGDHTVESLAGHTAVPKDQQALPNINDLHTPLYECIAVVPDPLSSESGGYLIQYKPREFVDPSRHSAAEIKSEVERVNTEIYPAVDPPPDQFESLSMDLVRKAIDRERASRPGELEGVVRALVDGLGVDDDAPKKRRIELDIKRSVTDFKKQHPVSEDQGKWKVNFVASTKSGAKDNSVEFIQEIWTRAVTGHAPDYVSDGSRMAAICKKAQELGSREWSSKQEADDALSQLAEEMRQSLHEELDSAMLFLQVRTLVDSNPTARNIWKRPLRNSVTTLIHRHHAEIQKGDLGKELSQELARLAADDLNFPDDDSEAECQFFNDLGYSYSDGVLTVPSNRALEVRWEAKRRQDPTLPKLRLAWSVGIASDLDFSKLLTENDAVGSVGGETLHDHFLHIKQVLEMMRSWKKPEYKRKHRNLFGYVIKFHKALANAKVDKSQERDLAILQAGLGAYVDTCTNRVELWESKYAELRLAEQLKQDPLYQALISIMIDPTWGRYFTRRFGEDALNFERLAKLSKGLMASA